MQAPPLSESGLLRHRRIRIIGQGLVGSLLALKLDDLGLPFVVQDECLPGAATIVAPGIVNPLAGRNFTPPDNLDSMMVQMRKVMELAAAKLGLRIWHPCPILRMFAESSQVDRLKRNLSDEEREKFIEEAYPDNTFDLLNDVFGSFLTKGGGWADLPALIRETRSWLSSTDRLVEEAWDTGTQNQHEGELLVYCEGWQVGQNPAWSFIPHNPAKGEMLIVRFEKPLPRDRIYNQSCWAQPIGEELWRIGATYGWSGFDSQPSLEGAQLLQERLHLMTPVPFHVEDQLAGVRPIVEDYQPVIGKHPEHDDWFILNAMGSKGVLQTSASIQFLLQYLQTGSGIPARWDVRRFYKGVSRPRLYPGGA